MKTKRVRIQINFFVALGVQRIIGKQLIRIISFTSILSECLDFQAPIEIVHIGYEAG